MKALALYIDKWYITGAVITDAGPQPLSLPNGEERVWLYFHEDTDNDELSYGRGFEMPYRNNQVHYYGDVFALMDSLNATYTRFGRKQPIDGIFKAAKVFDHLRANVGTDQSVDTYVSFSQDVSLVARQLLLGKMQDNGLRVVQSVARIGHLALERALRRGQLGQDGHYLVLNACNENLHYSMYMLSEGTFARMKEEDTLPGHGSDVRRRALVEYVVDTINRRERLLVGQQEREDECLRMMLYVDDWLARLSRARGAMPVTLSGITFANNPHHDYNVSVQRPNIEERTKAIVRDIVDEVARFVKARGVAHNGLRGIVMLGNTFGNEQFRAELTSRYTMDPGGVLWLGDEQIARTVGVYTEMDCDQFRIPTANMDEQAAIEMERIKRLKEEEAERERAMAERERLAEEERRAAEADKKFRDAMDSGDQAERDCDYVAMEEYFRIAMGLRPDDEEAKNMHAAAVKKVAEMAVKQENYKRKILQAKTAFDKEDWQTARQKATEALEDNPQSADARRIIDEATKHIRVKEDVDRYIGRADIFMAQQDYAKAMKEIEKGLLLDGNNRELLRRKAAVAAALRQQNEKIRALIAAMSAAEDSGDYDEALRLCNQLCDVDTANAREWIVKRDNIRHQQRKAQERAESLRALIAAIDAAVWDEQWQKVVTLCRKALTLRDDPEVREKLRRAEEKVAAAQQQREATERAERLKVLKAAIDAAMWDEQWRQAITLCREALAICDDETVRGKMKLAEAKDVGDRKPRRTVTRPDDGGDFFDTPTPPKTKKVTVDDFNF